MQDSHAAALAEIDAAALHMARTYGPEDPEDPERVRRQWAGRIRLWAHRYPDRITDHGRRGRRRRYDLAELQQVAADLVPDARAASF